MYNYNLRFSVQAIKVDHACVPEIIDEDLYEQNCAANPYVDLTVSYVVLCCHSDIIWYKNDTVTAKHTTESNRSLKSTVEKSSKRSYFHPESVHTDGNFAANSAKTQNC